MWIVLKLIDLYKWILIARCLLTWLPDIPWYKQPFRFLRQATDPVMEPFRRLIPPLGGMDISAILLFFALDLLEKALFQLFIG